MHRSGKPKWSVLLWGDWSLIISVVRNGPIWDELIGQKPEEADDVEYDLYHVTCEDTAGLMQVAAIFGDKGVKYAFGVDFKSDDGAVRVSAASGDGFGKDDPFIVVDANVNDEKLLQAVGTAMDILAEATA